MPHDDNLVISLYRDQHLTGTHIARATGISQTQVYRILDRAGVTRPLVEARRLYAIDASYFGSIDSHDKAQILGFLYADGCVQQKHQSVVTIALAMMDDYYLELIRRRVGYTGPIHHRERGGPNQQDVCILSMTCPQMVTDLIALGCVPCKSLVLRFPTPEQVPPPYLSSFLLGYFEGDGCLYIAKPAQDGMHRTVGDAEFSITSTRSMCEGFGETLRRECGVTHKIMKRHKTRANDNYTLKVLGNQQILRVMEYLYAGNTFRMERKWAKYQELRRLVDEYSAMLAAERAIVRQRALTRPRKGHGQVIYLKRRADGRVCEIRGMRRFQEMVGIGYNTLHSVLKGEAHPSWQAVSVDEVFAARESGALDKTHAA